MNEECSFYTDAVRDAANGKGFAKASMFSRDNNTFKYLDSFVLAFYDFRMYAYSVAGAEFRNVISQLFVFERFDNVHDLFLLTYRTFVPIAYGRGLSRHTQVF